MGISQHDFNEMTRRVAAARKTPVAPPEAVNDEGKLHLAIIDFCERQFPRWKYRHARMDRPTTEEKGIEDFTVFMPNGITAHVECKKKSGKQSVDQLAWQLELGRLGHKVYVVFSIEQFKALADELLQNAKNPSI